MIKRWIAPLIAVAVFLPLGGMEPYGNYAHLTANPGAPGATIPATALGLSWNKNGPSGYGSGGGGFDSGLFTTADTPLINLMRLLGSAGGFRVGGTPCMSSEAAPESSASIQAMHDMLAAAGSGWLQGVIWCLNMGEPTNGGSDSSIAVTEAGRVEAIFGPGVVTFSFGNEPDLYYTGGNTEATFTAQWNAMAQAVRGAVPTAKISGPELASQSSAGAGWLSGFFAAASPVPGLGTAHFYTNIGVLPSWTPNYLLMMETQQLGMSPNNSPVSRDLAAIAPQPMRMNEMNTLVSPSGGLHGISDAAVSATWAVNAAIGLLGTGWVGMDLTSICYQPPGNYYSPINGVTSCSAPAPDWAANPEFAGMELIANVAGSQILPFTQTGYSANIGVLATLTPAGKVAFLVANRDTSNPVSIVPQSVASWSTATATVIGGATPASLSVSINGVPMNSTGACSSSCPPTVYAAGVGITIPAAGAAYITLE